MSQPLVTVNKVPLRADQIEQIKTAMDHPGFSLLMQCIAAKAVDHCADSLESFFYIERNERAKEDYDAQKQRAQEYKTALDILDEFAVGGDSWFTVTLEHRR